MFGVVNAAETTGAITGATAIMGEDYKAKIDKEAIVHPRR